MLHYNDHHHHAVVREGTFAHNTRNDVECAAVNMDITLYIVLQH